jgi:hypothetical protein
MLKEKTPPRTVVAGLMFSKVFYQMPNFQRFFIVHGRKYRPKQEHCRKEYRDNTLRECDAMSGQGLHRAVMKRCMKVFPSIIVEGCEQSRKVVVNLQMPFYINCFTYSTKQHLLQSYVKKPCQTRAGGRIVFENRVLEEHWRL